MHSYIVTGPDAPPVVMTIEARMSVSYLACRLMLARGHDLTRRTFGEAFTHAWPAFEHDVLMFLTTATDVPHESQVRGLAAAILSRKEVPTVQAQSPLATLLASRPGYTILKELPKPTVTELPRKPARAPKKPSALQSLLAP